MPLLGRSEVSEAQRHRREALLKERADLLARLARQSAEESERLLLPLERIQKQVSADAALVLWVDATPLGEHWACVVRATGPPRWQRLPGTGRGKAWTREDTDLPAGLLGLLSQPASDLAARQRLSADVRAQRLGPLRPHLKGVRRLLLVPTWPMEALPVEVLDEEHLVSYVPSASVFARLMERHRPLSGTTLLALGDPVFSTGPAPEPPARGLMLRLVLPGGHAERAGLRAGDVLLAVNEQRLESADDLKAALARTPATVAYWREGEQRKARLAGSPLGAVVDPRSARAAVRAWRRPGGGLIRRGGRYRALPGTRLEVQALARLVPPATLLVGSAASEQNLAQLSSSGKLKGFRLLHFATHGEVDEQRPEQSALVLAQDRLPHRPAEAVLRGEKALEGRLTVATILRDWHLDADLVVLSACQTALGKESGGEGLLGFTQAFLQKGARSVVLSRWKVDDTATALLMVRFYENLLGKRTGLKRAMGRAEALEEAKKWLRQLKRAEAEPLAARLGSGVLRGTEGDVKPLVKGKEAKLPEGERPFAHPYYWAAFVLVGDPE